jgi:hypothetical protein
LKCQFQTYGPPPLNFNTDEDGGDVAVFLGDAKILDAPPDAAGVEEYLKKYRPGIKTLGMTVGEFTKDYSVPVQVSPRSLRGFTG